MPLSIPSFYPILDTSLLPSENRKERLRQLITELADAGVSLLQYRNKQSEEAEILNDAAVMYQSVGGRVRLIMNDHPELAVCAGFDGAHVGQEDMNPKQARKILGPDRILGVSTHNRAQIEIANTQPVDYIAIGPVFATSTKANPDPVIGLEGVREARKLTAKPLVAIGGITLENARQIIEAGADSVAVISALFRPDERAGEVARKFLSVVTP
jgi:thiamine-phosphate pyrophosphorylase